MAYRVVCKAILNKNYAKQVDAAVEAAELEQHLKTLQKRISAAMELKYIVKVEEIK